MPEISSQTPSTRPTEWAIAILIGSSVAILRWLTLDFDNDYFMHLAWAAEIRLGGLPVRDFVEPGFALQTLTSYALMKAFGYQLAAEGVVACTFIGAGAACTYAICRRLGLGRAVSAAAGILAALTYPRLYAYPKAFAYPAALLALAIHVDRPRRGTLALLALTTAVAFLLRNDHGVYVAVPAIGAVWFANGGEWPARCRAVGAYAALALLFTLPWIAWVAVSGHPAQYVRTLTGRGVNAVTRLSLPEHGLRLDPSASLIALDPVSYPRVAIRWSQNITSASQGERETRYHLEPAGDDEYLLKDFTATNVTALLNDPLIDDTRGIDRLTGRVPSGSFAWAVHRLAWWLPPLRVRLLPGLLNEANALPWLTGASFALPWILLIVGVVRASRARPEQSAVNIAILATAAMGIITYQKLVRGSPDSRIGDVAALTSITAAYLGTLGWRLNGTGKRPTRAAIFVLVAATAASAVAYGRVIDRLKGAGVDGPTNAARRAEEVFTRYDRHPVDTFAPRDSKGLAGLARWLHECTYPGQRVAVIGFEPEINVWAERGFAGGLAYFNLNWMGDPRDQQIALSRWRTQDVPFVLLMSDESIAFRRDYSAVSSWVEERYTPVRTSTFGGRKEVTVFVHRSAPVRSIDNRRHLPCLTTSADANSMLFAR